MTATATRTDMLAFEAAVDNTVCHLFRNWPDTRRSNCGAITRGEQQPHPYPLGTPDAAMHAPVCHCGLPRCQGCVDA